MARQSIRRNGAIVLSASWEQSFEWANEVACRTSYGRPRGFESGPQCWIGLSSAIIQRKLLAITLPVPIMLADGGSSPIPWGTQRSGFRETDQRTTTFEAGT